MAASYNFPDIVKGNTFKPRIFTFIRNGAPIDLTDAIVCMQLRKRIGCSEIVHTFDITITDAVNGEITINQWDVNLNANRYYYDITIEENTGRIFTYLIGQFEVLKNVSVCP